MLGACEVLVSWAVIVVTGAGLAALGESWAAPPFQHFPGKEPAGKGPPLWRGTQCLLQRWLLQVGLGHVWAA